MNSVTLAAGLEAPPLLQEHPPRGDLEPIQLLVNPLRRERAPTPMNLFPVVGAQFVTVRRPVRRSAPEVDAARATERETEPVVPRVVVRTEIREHVTRQRAHRMKIGTARFVRRRIGRKTIPPELRTRVGDEGELAFGDSELQGIAGHAAPE